MKAPDPNELSRQHLHDVLYAAHRTAWFMRASMQKFNWPVGALFLEKNRHALEVFEPLAAINERFGKLQDLLGSAMRHACLLLGEPTEPFLKVLAFFAKAEVIASSEDWIAIRQLRNAAAHEYGRHFADTARHFNSLHETHPVLLATLQRLTDYVAAELSLFIKLDCIPGN
jgi:hypothetical protein